MPHKVPLQNLYVAVQDAVEQVIAKHGGGPVEKLWVGFVAPEIGQISEAELAREVASKVAVGAGVTVSVGQLSAGPAGAAKPEILPHHILGLIFDPNAAKKV
jgi:hypothetical protein